MKTQNLIPSPLNYTGGKFKLLPQILPHFPTQMDTFLDLFSGGCNVGINVNANKVVFNDNSPYLLHLFNTFKNLGKETMLGMIEEIIDKYGLSKVAEFGYAHYHCDSSKGLADYNRGPFMRLREDFNKANQDHGYYVLLYVLIVYTFNNQMRFNSKGAFNLPVGKRDFNGKMKEKLCAFIDRLQAGNYHFSCEDFRKVNTSELTENSLVYCDPPYLITCATYNENGGWNEQCERDLLALLDGLNERNIKFALSNVLTSKGKTNVLLNEWVAQRNYHVIHLDYNYANSNYHTKDKTASTDEVLIVNY